MLSEISLNPPPHTKKINRKRLRRELIVSIFLLLLFFNFFLLSLHGSSNGWCKVLTIIRCTGHVHSHQTPGLDKSMLAFSPSNAWDVLISGDYCIILKFWQWHSVWLVNNGQQLLFAVFDLMKDMHVAGHGTGFTAVWWGPYRTLQPLSEFRKFQSFLSKGCGLLADSYCN